MYEKSARADGVFSRSDFTYGHQDDSYICPGGKRLRQRQNVYREARPFVDENGLMRYRQQARLRLLLPQDARCTPNMPARKILRSIHEARAISLATCRSPMPI